MIFRNDYKRGEKEPDYHMYIAPRHQQTKPITGNGELVTNEHKAQPL